MESAISNLQSSTRIPTPCAVCNYGPRPESGADVADLPSHGLEALQLDDRIALRPAEGASAGKATCRAVALGHFDRVAALSRIGCIFCASQNYTSANSPVFARSIGALHLQSPVFMSRKGVKDGLFGTSGILVFIPIVFILIAVDEYFF